MKRLLVFISLLPLVCLGQLSYPVAHTAGQVDTFHGHAVSDPYRWLESYDSADTRQWIQAENALTRSYLDSIPFRAALRKRLQAACRYSKYSSPYTYDGYTYYDSIDGVQDQWVLYRRREGGGPVQVVLDPNKLSEDHTTSTKDFSLSKDGKYGAYIISKAGSDWGDIYVMDMSTLHVIDDTIHWIKFSGVTWQGHGFYYCKYQTPDPGKELTTTLRNQKVYYHTVGLAHDSIVYSSTRDPEQHYSVEVSEDEQYMFLSKYNYTLGGNALLFRHHDSIFFHPIVSAIGGAGYRFIAADSQSFVILAGFGTYNGKLISHDIKTGMDKEIIPSSTDKIQSIQTGGGKIFITYQKDVSDHVYVYSMTGVKENEIALPGHGSVEGFDGLVDDTIVYYTYTSFSQPSTVYSYHIASRQSTVYHASESGFEIGAYEVEQVFYPSAGIAKVPMYIVHKKGIGLHQPHPLVLAGYGGFGISSRSQFDALLVPFLEAGGVYAVAGIRGGGEYGGFWHSQGSFMNKVTSFKDFIAGAKYLIKHKYTDRDHLAIRGGSNGGLLVTACANMEPDLFKVVIAEVPVTDMLRYPLYTAGPGWLHEYGSPDNKLVFDLLHSYSPLHNISTKKQYPATLVTTADHDDRVVPAHSFKYVATLQSTAGPHTKAPLLIRIDTNSGHSGSSASKYTETATDIYSFIFYNMGITPNW